MELYTDRGTGGADIKDETTCRRERWTNESGLGVPEDRRGSILVSQLNRTFYFVLLLLFLSVSGMYPK